MSKSHLHGEVEPSETLRASERLEKRLLLYALAAGAALAGAPSSHAQVIFTANDTELNGGQTLDIDLNNDGVRDFVLNNLASYLQCDPLCTSYGSGVNFTLSVRYGDSQGRNRIAMSSHGYADRLHTGATIGPPRVFRPQLRMLYERYSVDERRGGPWLYASFGFLGVRFVVANEMHYGWIGFRSVRTGGGRPATAVLLGWAYEERPDTPIFIDTPLSPLTESFSQRTSLELLAQGHEAIVDWRKRRLA